MYFSQPIFDPSGKLILVPTNDVSLSIRLHGGNKVLFCNIQKLGKLILKNERIMGISFN